MINSLSNLFNLTTYHEGDKIHLENDKIIRRGSEGSPTEFEHNTKSIAVRVLEDLHSLKTALSLSNDRNVTHYVLEQDLIQRTISSIRSLKIAKSLTREEKNQLNEDIQFVSQWHDNFRAAFDQHDYDFYSAHSPEMIETLSLCKEAIRLSQDPATPHEVKALIGPVSTGANTANGTYFIRTPKELTFPLAGLETTTKTAVVKPAEQETGMPGNPMGNVKSIREGIIGGKAAIRERFVYGLQQALRIEFGVPPTEIITADHPLLSGPIGVMSNAVGQISRECNMENPMENIISELANDPTLSTHKDIGIRVLQFFIESERSSDAVKAASSILIQSLTNGGADLKLATLNKLLRESGITTARPVMLKHMLSLYDAIKEEKSASLSSIQEFVPGCVTYADLGEEMLYQVPDEEMHKLTLDMIVFNMDRHMNNVLFKKEGDNIDVVLIDHGLSLPFPDSGNSLKNSARFEWIDLPQFQNPLHPKYASALADLKIDDFIEILQNDLTAYEHYFGNACHIEPACYMLVRLNLHLLQVGIRMGVPVKTMALFQQIYKNGDVFLGGEIVDVYQKHIGSSTSQSDVDWDAVESEIQQILSKPTSERLCSYERSL